MRRTKTLGRLSTVIGGVGLLIVVTASAGSYAGAADGPEEPGKSQATAAHTNGHGSDDARQSPEPAVNASSQPQASTSGGGSAVTSGVSTAPQPVSTADANEGGANGECPDGPYCSTRDGSASENGSGTGEAKGKPCAGCVGKADNKNPPGQLPDASDTNNGFECDDNHGIARGNPAHTTCVPEPTLTLRPTPECVDVVDEECVLGEVNERPNVPDEVLATQSPSVLPFTGASLAWTLALGLALLVVGIALNSMPTPRPAGNHAGRGVPALWSTRPGRHVAAS